MADDGDSLLTPEFEAEYCATKHVNGAIPICHAGCNMRYWLVVSGREAGHVWYDRRADWRGLTPVPAGTSPRATFASWYCEWLAAERDLGVTPASTANRGYMPDAPRVRSSLGVPGPARTAGAGRSDFKPANAPPALAPATLAIRCGHGRIEVDAGPGAEAGRDGGAMVGYVYRLAQRMQRMGWKPDDQLYVAAWESYYALHALHVHARYASCHPGTGGRPSEAPPVR